MHPFTHPICPVRPSVELSTVHAVSPCSTAPESRPPGTPAVRRWTSGDHLLRHAKPPRGCLRGRRYSSTRGAGASPDPAAILAPRWLRWVALRGEWVWVAARVCACTCTCEYPFGICMRRSGATRGVALSRDAGSDVTGRMPRECGTGGRGRDSGGTVQGVDCDYHKHESCYRWHMRDGNCTAEGMSWKKNDSVHSLRQPPCMHKGNYI
jgi:hypothetical protein